MISEGSCDTEDWSNMLKIQLCLHGNKFKYIQIENGYFELYFFFF